MEQQLKFSESFEDKYERRNHYVGISIWHFEWCTKYRYKMFQKEEYRALLEACVRRAASSHGIKFDELSVQPEHVHSVARIPGTMSPSKALHLLKGISSKLFFEKHPKARLRYPRGHLWSRGKFYASVGFVQIHTVREYVRNQDVHHSLGNRTF